MARALVFLFFTIVVSCLSGAIAVAAAADTSATNQSPSLAPGCFLTLRKTDLPAGVMQSNANSSKYFSLVGMDGLTHFFDNTTGDEIIPPQNSADTHLDWEVDHDEIKRVLWNADLYTNAPATIDKLKLLKTEKYNPSNDTSTVQSSTYDTANPNLGRLNSDGTFTLANKVTGYSQNLSPEIVNKYSIFSLDKQTFLYDDKNHTIGSLDSTTNQFVEKVKIPADKVSEFENCTFLPTSPLRVLANEKLFTYNESNKSFSVESGKTTRDHQLFYAIKTEGNKSSYHVVNTTTGAEYSLPYYKGTKIFDIFESKNYLCQSILNENDSTPNSSLCLNKTTGELKLINASTITGELFRALIDDNTYYTFSKIDNDWRTSIEKEIVICSKRKYVVDCDCLISNQDEIDRTMKTIVDTQMAIACQSNYKPELWSKINDIEKTNLTREDAIHWLMQFSKPGGFDPSLHSDILKAIMASSVYLYAPTEFQILKRDLLDHYPNFAKESGLLSLENDSPKGPLAEPRCLSPLEKKSYDRNFKIRSISSLGRHTLSQFNQELDKNADLFEKIMSPTSRDDIADHYGDRVADLFKDDEDLKGVFHSKIYKFAYNSALDKLKLPSHDILDVTTSRTKLANASTSLDVIEMTSKPCTNCKKSDGGFYFNKLASLPADHLADKTDIAFSLTYQNKKYQTNIHVSPVDLENSIDTSGSPNYADLWKDGDLHGLIVSNLPTEGNTTGQSYVHYYLRNGFTFDSTNQTVDTKEFMKSRIAGKDAADYFIKEAHSDGDEKNLFRLAPKSIVMHGVKTLDNGKKEEVDILVPADTAIGEHLSNTEFGDWMKTRVKDNNGTQLIYLNSSCNSSEKAIYEIPAVAEKGKSVISKFVEIPSLSYVYFFRDIDAPAADDRNNAKRFILDGLRTQKDWSSIRHDMEQDPKFKSNSGNIFALPDDKARYSQITEEMQMPILIDPQIQIQKDDGSWQPYTIDDSWIPQH